MAISLEKEIWFVHLGYEPPLPLKFERLDNFGAQIVGGKTGSHRTGHGQTYWDKFVEVVKLGYTPVVVAKEIGVLPATWIAPDVKTLDHRIKEGFFTMKHSSGENK